MLRAIALRHPGDTMSIHGPCQFMAHYHEIEVLCFNVQDLCVQRAVAHAMLRFSILQCCVFQQWLQM